MRSLFSFGESKEMSLAIAGSGHRPEVLRRKTLANNARIMIAVSGLAMPFAFYALIAGSGFGLLVAAIGLACGMITLTLHRRGSFEQAAAGQVYSVTAIGLLLTLAEPRLGDAGLAIALMAPVLAALVGRPAFRRRVWLLLPVVLALAGGAAWLQLRLPVVPAPMMMTISLIAFLTAIALVVHSAHRISSAYEVYDKSQVTAYRHLIEHVQDAVVRFASDGQILLASHSSERLFGCRRYQLTSSGMGERLHVLDRPAYLTAFADANQGGVSRTIEVRMRQDEPYAQTSVPKFIWVEISFAPIIDSEQLSARHEVVAVLRDVTARKAGEAEMASARQAAEAASQAKSRFLATIGHELRTPLNAVVGFSEMMSSGIGGDLSPTHAEYAKLIHQSGKHLLEVVQMLLDMSRIEAGKFEIDAEPFPVEDIIPPCLAMVEPLAGERQISIRSEIARDLPLLIADQRAVRQMVLNLLSNAVKFSHPGGEVVISAKRQGQSLNISVADKGVGMAPEALSRIGEPFFQAQDGLSRRYEGTGLGLSIVKGLVELHGGTLRAFSELGAGTTVTVLLPINGPAINSSDTAVVTPLRREPASAPTIPWQDVKRKAQ